MKHKHKLDEESGLEKTIVCEVPTSLTITLTDESYQSQINDLDLRKDIRANDCP